METLIIAIILVGLSMLGLAITMVIKKGGKFPDTHVGHNKEMKKRGVSCAMNEKMGCEGEKNRPECSSCHALN